MTPPEPCAAGSEGRAPQPTRARVLGLLGATWRPSWGLVLAKACPLLMGLPYAALAYAPCAMHQRLA